MWKEYVVHFEYVPHLVSCNIVAVEAYVYVTVAPGPERYDSDKQTDVCCSETTLLQPRWKLEISKSHFNTCRQEDFALDFCPENCICPDMTYACVLFHTRLVVLAKPCLSTICNCTCLTRLLLCHVQPLYESQGKICVGV